MPTALLIANIGNSDIGKDKNPIFASRNEHITIYDESRELWESKEFGSIELLLLDRVLRKIREMFDIEQVYLFYTEQSPPQRKDTKFIAHIVKSILCSRYDFDETSINLHAISKNPADYDEMLKLYRAELDNMPESADRVFISLAGGTPQQNFSAMLESVAQFEGKATMVYTPLGSEDAIEYGVGYEIYKRMITHRVDILKEKKMYGVAAELAEEYGILDTNEIKMLQAKNHRLLFDFESSQTIFNEVKDKLPEHQDEIYNTIDKLEKLKSGDMCVLIHELYENMLVKWEQGAYVDFLGRLFRFEEGVYYYLIQKKFEIDISKKSKHAEFIYKVISDDKLKKHLKGIWYNGDKLKFEVNRTFLYFVTSFYDKEFGLVIRVFDKVNHYKNKERDSQEPLGRMRNETIIAHGFEGVSHDLIDRKYKGGCKTLFKDLRQVIDFIDRM